MFVAASSECFPELSLDGVLQRLVDLEYPASRSRSTSAAASSSRRTCWPIWTAIAICRETYRLTIAGYSVDIEAEGEALLRAVRRLLPAGQGHQGGGR